MSTDLRLGIWYILAIGAVGMGPYFGVLLTDVGASEQTATWALLSFPFALMFITPAVTRRADAVDGVGLAIRICVGLAAVFCGLLLWAHTPDLRIPALVAFSMARAPINSLADGLAVRALRGRMHRYGPLRAAGSFAFMVVALVSGTLRDWDADTPLWIGGSLLGAAFLWTWLLPTPEPALHDPPPPDGPRPTIGLLLAVAFLNGLCLTTYDNLYAMRIDQAGLGGWVTGVSIATGVSVEVVLLSNSKRLLDRVSPKTLMALSVMVGVPRFLITGLTDDPAWLIAAQSLHGVQFGGFWLAAVHTISATVPDNAVAAAQGQMNAAMFGAATLVSMSVAGLLAGWLPLSVMFAGLAGVAVLGSLLSLRL